MRTIFQQPTRRGAICVWQYDSDYDTFATSCNQSFQFTTGGIIDNGFRFCPYCGRRILPVESAAGVQQ